MIYRAAPLLRVTEPAAVVLTNSSFESRTDGQDWITLRTCRLKSHFIRINGGKITVAFASSNPSYSLRNHKRKYRCSSCTATLKFWNRRWEYYFLLHAECPRLIPKHPRGHRSLPRPELSFFLKLWTVLQLIPPLLGLCVELTAANPVSAKYWSVVFILILFVDLVVVVERPFRLVIHVRSSSWFWRFFKDEILPLHSAFVPHSQEPENGVVHRSEPFQCSDLVNSSVRFGNRMWMLMTHSCFVRVRSSVRMTIHDVDFHQVSISQNNRESPGHKEENSQFFYLATCSLI